MSGIFCASLNLLTCEKTHKLDMPPFAPHDLKGDQVYMSGVLPKETVCTENLTPFLRLLPCDNRVGLASLLNPTRVFDGEYSMLDLSAKVNCDNGECHLEVKQNVRMVFNRLKWTGSCDWTVDKVFGRSLGKTCAGVQPQVTINKGKLGRFVGYDEVSLNLDKMDISISDISTVNCFFIIIDAHVLSGLGVEYDNVIPEEKPLRPPKLLTTATLAGVGQVRAVLSIHSQNNAEYDIPISQLIELPWYAKPFLHTIKLSLNGQPIDSTTYLYL